MHFGTALGNLTLPYPKGHILRILKVFIVINAVRTAEAHRLTIPKFCHMLREFQFGKFFKVDVLLRCV